MKTTTLHIAHVIAGALQRAAAASHQPIPVKHLYDPVACLRNGYLGARLCGLAFHWLNKEQGIPIVKLAKAFKMDHQTVSGRVNSAIQLKRTDPWKQIYDVVAQQPISPAVE
jgi:hypothetical protein